jgi:hypothetical protein
MTSTSLGNLCGKGQGLVVFCELCGGGDLEVIDSAARMAGDDVSLAALG